MQTKDYNTIPLKASAVVLSLFILFTAPSLLLAQETLENPTVPLKPFTSDGCSLFPDGNLKDPNAWCSCCVAHDLAYWQGGTKEQKESADQKLKQCVLTKTGNEILAEAMYQGVTYGGSPIFPNWYRWGYGWPYGRGFKPLSPEEEKLVEIEIQNFKQAPLKHRCPNWNEHPLLKR